MSAPDHEHDAILLLSFGGPEGPDDVLPFLENVTSGRGVPRERLEEVAQQYERFGGVSPINEQNRALLAALRAELDRRGIDLPLHWGNRNWAPFVEDTMTELADAGHRRVLALATSAYASYSACRQYLEDIERARAHVGDRAPVVDKIRPYWDEPGFREAVRSRVADAVAQAPAGARLVFTAHSIPLSMASTSDYETQLRAVASATADAVAPQVEWDLVFQSRSGPPRVPWLEPDIVDHLHALHDGGTTAVVVAPIGFVSDHMEVKFALDTQAAEAARELGMTMVRAGTVGTHPAFVSGLVDLIERHAAGNGAVCPPDCCPAPARGRPTPVSPAPS